jgi:hypothetical protein
MGFPEFIAPSSGNGGPRSQAVFFVPRLTITLRPSEGPNAFTGAVFTRLPEALAPPTIDGGIYFPGSCVDSLSSRLVSIEDVMVERVAFLVEQALVEGFGQFPLERYFDGFAHGAPSLRPLLKSLNEGRKM